MKKLLIFSIVCIFFAFGCTKREEEIFIITQGFRGRVLIIFNHKDGILPEYDNRKRLYRVPANGILKIKLSPINGWKKFPKFYYQEIFEKNSIPYRPTTDEVKLNDLLFVYGGISGTVIKDTVTRERIDFSEYYVGTKSEIERYQQEASKLDIIKLAE